MRCGAEPVVGPCRAAFKRWYYNAKTGSCESFIYGGCKGNANNYRNESDCVTACTGELHACLYLHWAVAHLSVHVQVSNTLVFTCTDKQRISLYMNRSHNLTHLHTPTRLGESLVYTCTAE